MQQLLGPGRRGRGSLATAVLPARRGIMRVTVPPPGPRARGGGLGVGVRRRGGRGRGGLRASLSCEDEVRRGPPPLTVFSTFISRKIREAPYSRQIGSCLA